MTDDSKNHRSYRVLKAKPPQPNEPGPEWRQLGSYTVGSERAAIRKAVDAEPEAERGGVYIAVARFNPINVEVKPVTQTRLTFS